MQYVVSATDFSIVFPIWRNNLWPERESPIEATSALLFKGGIDMSYKSHEAFFLKMEKEGQTVGVVSGQRTRPHEFRFRGLYCFKNFRRQGLGSRLFFEVEKEAKKRGGSSLWGLCRHSKKAFYLSVGMKDCGITKQFEYGPHLYMFKKI